MTVTLFSPGVFEMRDQVLEEDMESTEDRLLLASQVMPVLQKCLIELFKLVGGEFACNKDVGKTV